MRLTIGQDQLHYHTIGQGTPIIALHDGLGLDHTILRPWLDNLADSARLTYLDLRGHGRSGGRQRLHEDGVGAWVEDLEQLRQALGHPRVVLLGHGLGGQIAQAYAHAHPRGVRALVLCATSAALDYPQTMLSLARQQASDAQVASIVRVLSGPVDSEQTLRALWSSILPTLFFRFDPKLGSAMLANLNLSPEAHNHTLFTLAEALSCRLWAAELGLPTLLVGGRHDWLTPAEEGLGQLAGLLGAPKPVILEESGHFPFIEEPVAFCQSIRTFLRTLP